MVWGVCTVMGVDADSSSRRYMMIIVMMKMMMMEKLVSIVE
jgi:hypothetical protein